MLVRKTEAATLMDREAVSTLTRRSVHTIRARCPVHSRTGDGRPLYDVRECVELLSTITTRVTRVAVTA